MIEQQLALNSSMQQQQSSSSLSSSSSSSPSPSPSPSPSLLSLTDHDQQFHEQQQHFHQSVQHSKHWHAKDDDSECDDFNRQLLKHSIFLKMRNWLLIVDAQLCFIIGAILFILPSTVADFVFIDKTDGVHWHLIRCIGGQKLAAGFVMYRLRKSANEALSACYLIRILGISLTLLIFAQCSSVTPELIHPEYLKLAKYWWSIWLILNISLQTIHGWTVGAKLTTGNRIGNFLYQIDTLASLTIGAAWLAFPKWLLHRQVSVVLNESHEICARLMGAYFLTSYAVSTYALHWKSSFDRIVAVDSRAVVCITILFAQIWSQFAYFNDWNGAHWIGISLFSSWTITSFLYRYTLTLSANDETNRKLR